MRRATLAVSFLVLFAAGNAAAAPLDILNVTGGWVAASVVPAGGADVANAANQGTDTIRWPAGLGSQSGLDFTPGADILGVPLGVPFLLGTFVHHNQPTSGTITDVDYSFGFDTNGLPAALNDAFHFDVNDTPNSSPCGFPSVSVCDDFITVSSVTLNSLITVGGDAYYFNLLGFSKDGGTTITTVFQTEEAKANSAGLYGVVTSQPVPEPASLVLLSLGLASAAASRRNTRRGR